MSKLLSLLFVCDQIEICSSVQACLEREGCRVSVAINTDEAMRMMAFPASAIDAVLIHDNSIERGSTLASKLKLTSPRTPVMLISRQWPGEGICPSGPDALCRAASLDALVTSDLANFIRYLIAEKSLHLVAEPNPGSRPFVPRKPIYLN